MCLMAICDLQYRINCHLGKMIALEISWYFRARNVNYNVRGENYCTERTKQILED